MSETKPTAYFTIPGCDLQMFRCSQLNASLSTRGCASRWTAAQGGIRHNTRLELRAAAEANPCVRCPIGAAHAGKPVVTYSRDFASDRCPRCDQGTTRMIHGRVCVSCYNREREVRTGVNGRGNAPRELAALAHLPLRIAIDGLPARAEPRVIAVRHLARVKVGRQRGRGGKPGRPIYAEVERGGLPEATAQVLRLTKGCVDLLPIMSVALIASQGRLAL